MAADESPVGRVVGERAKTGTAPPVEAERRLNNPPDGVSGWLPISTDGRAVSSRLPASSLRSGRISPMSAIQLTDGPSAVCARHAGAAAGYQCYECGRLLCDRCVKVGSHLIFCGVCGERAVELAAPERPGPPPRSVPLAPATGEGTATVGVFAVNHVVIPAATIAMVSALLFYLVDVRSVFLSGSERLKWVGFCFVAATVLTARYGRTSASAERQGCYTSALAAAMIAAMTLSPWANPSGGLAEPVANLVIILVVWRFATRLTERLSFEGLGKADRKPRLYGVERLRLEQWQREHDPTSSGSGVEGDDGAGDPVVPVARLVAVGLVVFALGEPFLLAAPPAVGERALGAMIVFLLAAGTVLAAGAGLGALQRVRSLGGEASLGMLPGRIASAGVVMVLLLALALAMPGFEYQGSGALRRPAAEDGAPGDGDPSEQADEAEEAGEAEQPPGDRQRGDESSSDGERHESESADRSPGRSGTSLSMIGQLAELGKWLRLLMIAVAAILALWGVWRLLSRLGAARRWLAASLGSLLRRLRAGLGDLYRRLRAGFASFFGRRRPAHPARRIEPFADWDALRRLPPRQAVVAAYGRLLAAFELLEHPRPERQTPYEFLASVPARLKRFAGPAGSLTEAYVKAAYSGADVGDADRREAFAALEEIKALVDARPDS